METVRGVATGKMNPLLLRKTTMSLLSMMSGKTTWEEMTGIMDNTTNIETDVDDNCVYCGKHKDEGTHYKCWK